MDTAESAFLKYCEAISADFLGRVTERASTKLHAVPPTPAKLAELAENSKASVTLHEELRAKPPYFGRSYLQELLRECGIYSRLLRSIEDPRSIWRDVVEKAGPRRAEIRRLVALEGLDTDTSIQVGGAKITKFETKFLPSYEEARPHNIPQYWLESTWFLQIKTTEDVGSREFPVSRELTVEEAWRPLLLLLLFKGEPFWLGDTLQIEQARSLLWYETDALKLKKPDDGDVPAGERISYSLHSRDYGFWLPDPPTKSAWKPDSERLLEFEKTMAPALDLLAPSGSLSKIAGDLLAARELSGFGGDGHGSWQPRDWASGSQAFLMGISLLEQTLPRLDTEQGSKQDQFARTVARFVGNDPSAESSARELYRLRNATSHKETSKDVVKWRDHLWDLWGLTNTALATWIASRDQYESDKAWKKGLRSQAGDAALLKSWERHCLRWTPRA